MLVGIFTQDVNPDRRYRKKFIELFAIDPRACSLAEYVNGTVANGDGIACELIYTIVAGALRYKDGPKEQADDSRPVVMDGMVKSITADFNYPDMTHLNIVYVFVFDLE